MEPTTKATLSPEVEDPYHSRGARSEVVPRRDPVVWSDTVGPWSEAELRQYAADGYRFLPSLFSESETAELLQEAERLAATANRREPGVITEPDSDTVRSIFRLHRTSEVFRRVCEDPRLADVARQLLGSEVSIHQSRINYKPAFDGKDFFWHSDFETWHMEDGMPRMRAVSVSLLLTESTPYNGPLIVVPGSHEWFVRCPGETPEQHYEKSLKKQEYGVPSRDAMRTLVERGGMTAPTGPPGSALLFECNTMHGSAGNLSPYPRVNFFVVFNSVENRVGRPYSGQPPRPEYLAERDLAPLAG
jgi:ectoine hydroxylase